MSSVNKVTVLGRLGKDPEVRHFENGSVVAKVVVATSEKYTNKEGQKVETTEWHNIVFWGGLAGVVEKYVKKGDQIYVEGKLKTRSWDDQDGNKRYATDIQAREMVMLGGNRNAANTENRAPESVYEAEAQNHAPKTETNTSYNNNATQTATVATAVTAKKNEDGVPFEDDLPF